MTIMLRELFIIYARQVLVIISVNEEFVSIDFCNLVYAGLDVHDCESIPFSEKLQSGNVITIEPGR